MQSPKQALLRAIPAVDVFIQDAALAKYVATVPRRIIVDCVRDSVEDVRKQLLTAEGDAADHRAIRRVILVLAERRIRSAMGPHYCRVINGTGIILHTGLGRAVLPHSALRQIYEELAGYSLLQTDIEGGGRSTRDGRIQWLLQQLTGAEAATVVNNNAAATMIALNTVAGGGKEVIVSRGQLVEIGGSFRLPDVMAASGAKLVEVGTTNKTHARDYEQAVTENTAAIMRVHPSNYKVCGFASEVPLKTLVKIARDHNLMTIDDVGAGPLVDFSQFGFAPEPLLQESVQAGADLITCSADKLIGAAQGGIILGRPDAVQAVRKNPFARILRVGKLTLTALEATLSLFLDESLALREVPTLQMLRRGLSELAEQAQRIADAVTDQDAAADVETVDGNSQMGSGSLPTQNLPTCLVAICPQNCAPDELAARLRGYQPPIFTRIQNDRVLVDPRTLLKGEEEIVVQALVEILQPEE